MQATKYTVKKILHMYIAGSLEFSKLSILSLKLSKSSYAGRLEKFGIF